MISLRLGVVAVLFILAACGKKEPPPQTQPRMVDGVRVPAGFDKLPPESQAFWIEQEKRQPMVDSKKARYRAELVRPAPAGFKPESVDRKIKITLIPQKTIMRRGERFWYRLEMQNVGREPIDFGGFPFFDSGNEIYGPFEFFVTPPGGKAALMRRIPAMSAPFGSSAIKFPVHYTDEMKAAAFKKMQWESQAVVTSVRINPGEIMVTLPWRYVEPVTADNMHRRGLNPNAVPGIFRELPSTYDFKLPGTYRIKAVYSDPPLKPSSEDFFRSMEEEGVSRKDVLASYAEINKRRLGIINSNSVVIEVVP